MIMAPEALKYWRKHLPVECNTSPSCNTFPIIIDSHLAASDRIAELEKENAILKRYGADASELDNDIVAKDLIIKMLEHEIKVRDRALEIESHNHYSKSPKESIVQARKELEGK